MMKRDPSGPLLRDNSNLSISRKFTKYLSKRKTSIFSPYANENRRLWDDIGQVQKIVLVIWWAALVAGYITMNCVHMSSYHQESSSGSTMKMITTRDTAEMFYNAESYVLFALYVNGCYVQPTVHLTMLVLLTFLTFSPKRKRYLLGRMRFWAKFTILPTFTLLFLTVAVDRHVFGFLEASVYVKPRLGTYIQFLVGPGLMLLETWVIRLNDCAAPDIQNNYITRMSLIFSGASVVCWISFLYSNIMEVEILGLLRSLMSETDDPYVSFVLPKVIADVSTKDGMTSFDKFILPLFYSIYLLVIPGVLIVVEFLWRILTGEEADETDPNFKPYLPTLEFIRNQLRMFYLYDIFLISLIFTALQLQEVSHYISKSLDSQSCKLWDQFQDSPCFDVKPTLLSPWMWLVAHVVCYYISCYTIVIYQRTLHWLKYWNATSPPENIRRTTAYTNRRSTRLSINSDLIAAGGIPGENYYDVAISAPPLSEGQISSGAMM